VLICIVEVESSDVDVSMTVPEQIETDLTVTSNISTEPINQFDTSIDHSNVDNISNPAVSTTPSTSVIQVSSPFESSSATNETIQTGTNNYIRYIHIIDFIVLLNLFNINLNLILICYPDMQQNETVDKNLIIAHVSSYISSTYDKNICE
jgi:hypothetical protein